MISKNQQKYIKSLELKKNRKKDNVFVAEGFKIVEELIQAGYHAKMIVGCEDWINHHPSPITHHLLHWRQRCRYSDSLQCRTAVHLCALGFS